MQRTVSTTFISLPLAKYSRSTDALPNATDFTWSHLTTDLYIIIDTFRGTPNTLGAPSQQLKVVHGSQVKESVAVEELVRQSHNFITTMRHLNAEVKNEHLPISALVRRPLLAFRWNLPEPSNLVRRIQLRFKTNEDFDTMYNHLRELGLSMSDPRPATASSIASHKSAQGTISTQSRPMDVGIRPSTTSLSVTTPRVSSPLARHPMQQSVSSSLNMSTTADFRQPEIATHSFSPVIPPEYFQRPDSGGPSLPDLPATANASSSERPFTHQFSFTPFVPRPITNSRPSSDNMLPPRRELPFERSLPESSGEDNFRSSSRPSSGSSRTLGLPKSSGSDDNRPLSRALSSSMGPPPRPTSSRGRSGMKSDLPVPTFTPEAIEPPRPSSGSSLAKNALPDLPPLPAPTFLEAAEREGTADDFSRSFQTPISTTRKSPRLGELDSGRQKARSSPSPPQPPASTPEAVYQDRVFQEILKAGNGEGQENLDSYAKMTADERRATLDDFMMALIDDESFITLVEDVSTCWTRIGLGLG